MTQTNNRYQPRLTGAPNFRDMGGYATHDRRTVRHRRLFRSGGLSDLTSTDLEHLGTLGIELICDIRSQHEKELFPSKWPSASPAQTLHFDISADMRAANDSLRDILLTDPTERGAHAMMLHTYSVFPAAFAGNLHLLFDHLLENDGGVVIHCTAGKDRTGFLCAMLLSALGVPTEVIYEDFLLSAKYLDMQQLAISVTPIMAAMLREEPDPRIINAINGVVPEYLDSAFAALKTSFGSVDAYLEKAGGLTAEKRSRLQNRLLE